MKEIDEISGFGPEDKNRVAYLVAGFLEKNLTADEESELEEWINASESNQRLFDDLIDPDKLKEAFAVLNSLEPDKAWQKIEKRRTPSVGSSSRWIKYAAAAAIVIVAGLSIVFYVKGFKDKVKNEITGVKADILPGTNTAILVLSNGSTINMADLPDGPINQEPEGTIKKWQNKELIYDKNNTANKGYNTLKTPNGGQYGVMLADGSKVILNASSSLKYPLSFEENQREVELTGEAFFDVSRDNKRPFIVKTNNQIIQVLGTRFNVNAYSDDSTSLTTLVSGSVKVQASGKQLILQPGYQSALDRSGHFAIHKAEIPEVIAWTEGNFEFINTPIETIMKQVSRWYDAEIVYEAQIPYHFNASISRDVPVSKLLQLLEATGRVHFKIDGKKIFVTR